VESIIPTQQSGSFQTTACGPCLVLPCLVLSCLVLSCSCLVFSSLVLPLCLTSPPPPSDVVESCSSNHPELCIGISWKRGTAAVNHTELVPPSTVRTYSSAARAPGTLNANPGWLPQNRRKGEWMQIDLGEARKVTGVVTQARGNNCCGPHGVTHVSFEYSSNGVEFQKVPGGVFQGPTVAFLTTEWASNFHRKFPIFFPAVITARYIRLVVEAWYGLPALRAEVLLHLEADMYSGKHVFRRCLESYEYTRRINVGELTESDVQGLTEPNKFSKSVDCPGCYQCREVPLPPERTGLRLQWGKRLSGLGLGLE
jgi:hypothetical protein